MTMTTTKLGLRQHLSRYIREQTRDGEELVNLCLDIVRGKVSGKANAGVAEDLRLRLAALDWLADRAFGKAPMEIIVDTDGGVRTALAEYTLEQLERMSALMDQPVIETLPHITQESVFEALCGPAP